MNPYDHAEQRPASRLDPDPLYVPHHEEVRRQPRRRYGWIVFASVVVVLAILAVTLLLAAPRTAPDRDASASLPVGQEQSGASRRVTTTSPADEQVRLVVENTVRPESSAGVAPQTVIGPPLLGEVPDTTTSVVGTASWYCGGGSACTRGYPPGTFAAAAGPALRVGDWRGRIVRVCAVSRCVRVALIDWCACQRRVIDLYRLPFSKLASPSRGLVRVEVSWGGRSTAPLPPTGTE